MLNTITKRKDFAYLKKYGKRVKGRYLILVKADRDCSIPLACFIASKKSIGTAVKRNRAKRRMRSIWMENISAIASNSMYLLIANSGVLICDYKQLVRDFLWCLERLNSCVNTTVA